MMLLGGSPASVRSREPEAGGEESSRQPRGRIRTQDG